MSSYLAEIERQTRKREAYARAAEDQAGAAVRAQRLLTRINDTLTWQHPHLHVRSMHRHESRTSAGYMLYAVTRRPDGSIHCAANPNGVPVGDLDALAAELGIDPEPACSGFR